MILLTIGKFIILTVDCPKRDHCGCTYCTLTHAKIDAKVWNIPFCDPIEVEGNTLLGLLATIEKMNLVTNVEHIDSDEYLQLGHNIIIKSGKKTRKCDVDPRELLLTPDLKYVRIKDYHPMNDGIVPLGGSLFIEKGDTWKMGIYGASRFCNKDVLRADSKSNDHYEVRISLHKDGRVTSNIRTPDSGETEDRIISGSTYDTPLDVMIINLDNKYVYLLIVKRDNLAISAVYLKNNITHYNVEVGYRGIIKKISEFDHRIRSNYVLTGKQLYTLKLYRRFTLPLASSISLDAELSLIGYHVLDISNSRDIPLPCISGLRVKSAKV